MIKDTGNELLSEHLAKAPHNVTYLSKNVQDELIVIAADLIRKSIVMEVKAAKEFSILADEASDVSCKEQLSLVVSFVDQDSNIREEFLGFLHCKDGTSGEALANLIVDQLEVLGVDIADCRGQGYDGAGSMSGKYKGVAARIMKVNELAIYRHCQAHSLSLCVCFACKMPVVITMMNKLRCSGIF